MYKYESEENYMQSIRFRTNLTYIKNKKNIKLIEKLKEVIPNNIRWGSTSCLNLNI